MPCKRLKDYLERNNIQYSVINHPLSFSAQTTAHLSHISGKDVVKTVIVKIKGDLKMMVLPANQMVNLRFLKNLYGTEDVELARESEFAGMFPDCEIGAMPPFGSLYGIEELVSEDLTKDEEIAFNAGNHTELLKIRYRDYENLLNPRIINFKIRM